MKTVFCKLREWSILWKPNFSNVLVYYTFYLFSFIIVNLFAKQFILLNQILSHSIPVENSKCSHRTIYQFYYSVWRVRHILCKWLTKFSSNTIRSVPFYVYFEVIEGMAKILFLKSNSPSEFCSQTSTGFSCFSWSVLAKLVVKQKLKKYEYIFINSLLAISFLWLLFKLHNIEHYSQNYN